MASQKNPSIQDSFTQDVTHIKKKNRISRIIFWLLGLAILAGLIGGGYWYYINKIQNNPQVLGANSNPTQKSDEEKAGETLDKLNKILLVEDLKDKDGKELKPAIAKVTDKEKVKGSNAEFYKNVENDDVLVVFPNRAIIFREKDNKIINVAPIANQQSPAAPATPDTVPLKK
jgi:Na+-transporting NADH:ubiquinone oxidoreductase subunit NqrC